MSDSDQPLNELYMYFMLNYLCMPNDVPVQELVRKYKGPFYSKMFNLNDEKSVYVKQLKNPTTTSLNQKTLLNRLFKSFRL